MSSALISAPPNNIITSSASDPLTAPCCDISLSEWIQDYSEDYSTIYLNENTGVSLPSDSDVPMNNVSALSISPGLRVSLDPSPHSGGETASPPEFLDDNPIERGTNVMDISESAEASEDMLTQHLMVENSLDHNGGAGTKKPSKMRPRNTLTPR